MSRPNPNPDYTYEQYDGNACYNHEDYAILKRTWFCVADRPDSHPEFVKELTDDVQLKITLFDDEYYYRIDIFTRDVNDVITFKHNCHGFVKHENFELNGNGVIEYAIGDDSTFHIRGDKITKYEKESV